MPSAIVLSTCAPTVLTSQPAHKLGVANCAIVEAVEQIRDLPSLIGDGLKDKTVVGIH